MKKILKNYTLDAILFIIAGVVLLIRPTETELFLLRGLGVLLLVFGAVKLIGYFTAKDDDGKSLPKLLLGILQAVAGIALLAVPQVFAAAVPVIAGLVIAVGAVISILQAIRIMRADAQNPFALPSLIVSIITLVLGVIVIFHPMAIAGFIVRLIGIALLAEGLSLLLSAGGRKD